MLKLENLQNSSFVPLHSSTAKNYKTSLKKNTKQNTQMKVKNKGINTL